MQKQVEAGKNVQEECKLVVLADDAGVQLTVTRNSTAAPSSISALRHWHRIFVASFADSR